MESTLKSSLRKTMESTLKSSLMKTMESILKVITGVNTEENNGINT
jgi:hypothetical protein